MMSTTIVLKSTTNNFPHRSTSFVGRRAELRALDDLLQNPACRLLTLVGPGGVGKTRLAIEAAFAALPSFADGLCFAELDEVYTASLLVSTLLDGIGAALPTHGDPQTRLYEYFSPRSMLLVLDNFEQLVEVGGPVLTELLANAPGLKLLITSREVLSLEEEWLYPVQGLTLSAATNAAIEESDAIQLFADRVARIRRDFSLPAELAHVKLICQLVEGAPLAIELAASWARTLTCAEIAAEIQHNLDFLTTNLRNLPERHRNMQAVFAQSWSLLSTVEQAILCRLSIFRGGFRRQAAEQVTGATLLLLSKLVDKSLVRWEANGRYQIHGLLRQYSLNRLQADPVELQRLQTHHCAYYTQLLNRPGEADFRQPHHPLVQDIRMEWDNIYAAWLWALQERVWDPLEQMAQPLAAFLHAQSRYQDCIDLFAHALTHLRATPQTPQTQQLFAYLLAVRGHALLLLGRLDSAESSLQESRQIYQQLGFPHRNGLLTDPVLSLSIIAWMRSDFTAARDYGAEGRYHAAVENNPYNLGYAHIMLSGAYYALGDYGATRHHAHQAFALIEPLEDRWLLASAHNELGKVAMVEDDFAAAALHFQASYSLRQELGHLQGMAMAHMLHGENERRRANWASAEQLFAEALPIYEKTGDQKGVARTLAGLAEVAAAQQRHDVAREHFMRALAIVETERLATYAGVVLVGLGEWLLVVGDRKMGQLALVAVIANQAGTADLRLRAQQILHAHGLPQPEQSQPILPDMTALVQQLQLQITALPLPQGGAPPQLSPAPQSSASVPTPQPLIAQRAFAIEPLTPRELEVLGLVAQGLSNQAIANQLFITLGTVKSYTAAIYGKLGVRSRTQAIALARELKLLP